jgi:hypothetical protein
MQAARCASDGLASTRHAGRQRTEDDIALYVSSQISSHAKFSKLPLDIKHRIEQELVKGANGM